MCSYHIKNVISGYNFIPFYSILDDQERNYSLPVSSTYNLMSIAEGTETRNYPYYHKNLHFITNSPISLPLPMPE